ncbi:GNAT family N-acetyltransferase [Roseovarius sp. C7]|uniref:GNAT family N-acetyltransferase n=1 Tax=Roseovarius sp. C7 TaxID=3398643 RepID=UPI0039F6A211
MTGFSIHPGIPMDQRDRAAALYWEAFGPKLSRVMGPTPRAEGFLRDLFDDRFALSAVDARGQLVGLAGFKTHEGSLTGGGLGDLARSYGWAGALWRGLVLALLERETLRDVLLMDGICVAREARGQGIGSALLDAILAEARRHDLPRVRLDVVAENPRARALYERKGFVAAGDSELGLLRHVFGFDRATAMYRSVS